MAAIKAMKDTMKGKYNKHIGVKYYSIRRATSENELIVDHVKGAENRADIFTKALNKTKHNIAIGLLGIILRHFQMIGWQK